MSQAPVTAQPSRLTDLGRAAEIGFREAVNRSETGTTGLVNSVITQGVTV